MVQHYREEEGEEAEPPVAVSEEPHFPFAPFFFFFPLRLRSKILDMIPRRGAAGSPLATQRSSESRAPSPVQRRSRPLWATDTTPFSSDTPEDAFDRLEQIPCHIVYTNKNTHNIIKKNITQYCVAKEGCFC